VKIELKPFQETAAALMREALDNAQREARRGSPQAIVLSSPTGSGKTVTITALMERIREGYEAYTADRKATFLWLSDSPELNAQSRDKILQQSSAFEEHDVVMIESHFSREQFEAGKIYFLNTQKLGKDSLLTKPGDGREYTIWQTIENTSSVKPGHFYLIIDEAHRGMMEKRGQRARAQSIVQRFIKGYPEAGMQPIKLVIGMSATPDRFNTLIEGTNRISRPIPINPQEVKESGLLKDKIVLFYPEERQPADWSLLEEATRRWKTFRKAWKKYCVAQRMEHIVEPVLVIQVEDGNDRQITRTNLEQLVEIVHRAGGKLPEKAWAHAFQEDKAIAADGQMIRKIEASKIEADPDVQVVLFKMSLTTGWDCPRAEVMMSFRKAIDSTLIAQLVGRMVRTPLARSIEGDDFLNTVSLYLPHYDEKGLRSILDKLNNPDPEIGPLVGIEDGTKLVPLIRDPKKSLLFQKLEKLPTYRVDRITKTSNVRRLMKLARLLAFDEIAIAELDKAKKLVVRTLSSELTRLKKQADFVGEVSANQEIEVREVWVEYGEWKEQSPKTRKVPATPENIEDLFSECSRKLGEGLHMEFWRSKKEVNDDPMLAKLQLFGILQDKHAWVKLEKVSSEKIDELYKKYADEIEVLPSGRREEYHRIKRTAKQPEAERLLMPEEIEVREERPLWERHLYMEKKHGKFGAKFNKWETKVLTEELARDDVVGWLRNVPRKNWAFCVPYQMHGEYRPVYPDFIVFRKEKKKIIADLLDPHESGLADAVDKAKGLAIYARDHGSLFGRIELIVLMPNDEIRRLDLGKEAIRNRVLKLSGKDHLDLLFEDSH
jgi:type III restriction enzyme